MASPSAYNRLIEAGKALVQKEVLASGLPPTQADVAAFLSANARALDTARRAIHEGCRVPLEYDAAYYARHVDQLSPLRDLARGFALELEVARGRGDVLKAMQVGVDLLDLSAGVRLGGLMTDLLVSVAIESMGIDHLRRLRHQLSPPGRATLIQELMRLEENREPFCDVVARDKEWEVRVGWDDPQPAVSDQELLDLDACGLDEESQGALREVIRQMAELPDDARLAFSEQSDKGNLALVRLLVIDLALSGYREAQGCCPDSLAALAPEHLAVVPMDPFTGGGFRYGRGGDRFLLYSPGPSQKDKGGTFGSWMAVQAGTADLCLDVHDHQDACRIPDSK